MYTVEPDRGASAAEIALDMHCTRQRGLMSSQTSGEQGPAWSNLHCTSHLGQLQGLMHILQWFR